jgi:hypothetical protein
MELLKFGSSGNMVKDVQSKLIELGFSCGAPGIDGKLGQYTEQAVREFQRKNSLVVDGIVGPKTMAKLDELINAKKVSEAEAQKPAVEEVPKINTNPVQDLTASSTVEAPKSVITIVNTTFTPPQSITFYQLCPDDLTESHQENFEPVDIKSRSNPLQAYSGSSSRSIDLSIDVHEDYLRAYSQEIGKADIVAFIAQLKALTYPRYQQGVVIPPKCFVKVGDFFRMKAICTSVSVAWKKPLRDNKYISATISMSFNEILSISFSADEIASGGDLQRYLKWST